MNKTIADVSHGFADMFRVGEGTACAFADNGDNIYGRTAYVAPDITQAANLFTTMAGPFAGRAGVKGKRRR